MANSVLARRPQTRLHLPHNLGPCGFLAQAAAAAGAGAGIGARLPMAEPAYSLASQAEVQLRSRDREMVIALLAFVACGLKYGSPLEEMEAVALDELERARKLAAQKQR
jgi:hypothetical protein